MVRENHPARISVVVILESFRQNPNTGNSLHPLTAKAQEEALSSQLADLESELSEYESLKAGDLQLDSLKVVADLPSILIKARIAHGLSQKDLAERIGIKEEQIQRCEATDYSSANLARIKEVVSAFGVEINSAASTPDRR